MDFNFPDHLDEVPTAMIKLKSSDGEIFKVEVKVAQVSLHLRQMLDDLGVYENEVISIPQNAPKISGTILGKILLWATTTRTTLPWLRMMIFLPFPCSLLPQLPSFQVDDAGAPFTKAAVQMMLKRFGPIDSRRGLTASHKN